MLILTRATGQQVEIYFPGQPPVVITVNEVRGRRVVLAFKADPAVRILRPEARPAVVPINLPKAG